MDDAQFQSWMKRVAAVDETARPRECECNLVAGATAPASGCRGTGYSSDSDRRSCRRYVDLDPGGSVRRKPGDRRTRRLFRAQHHNRRRTENNRSQEDLGGPKSKPRNK